ncbi:MAG: endonuclease domain-containing protein [Proteobacteria bacterium]|nr:endonuclease domain-containing protein [Pseudomonadota bacterium]
MTRFSRTREKTARARALRRAATKHEKMLWPHLTDAKMGVSFRQQHPLGPYYLDFYASSIKLAVELDGGQHGTDAAQAHDAARDRYLAHQGIRVLRFANHELNDNLDGVLEGIWRAVHGTPTGPASPGVLPLSGGGIEHGNHH